MFNKLKKRTAFALASARKDCDLKVNKVPHSLGPEALDIFSLFGIFVVTFSQV
jgi:hypothetical protein